jgi:acyl-CoA reductase-like NAD-dependent aldehyde dehydrogenase
VKDAFIGHLLEAIHEFYGDDPKVSPDYGRVINRRNFDRLVRLLASGKVAVGGQTDAKELFIAPTVLVDVSPESPIMQEEVFGPILPVLEIDSVEAVIQSVNSRPPALGVYVFAENASVVERILVGSRERLAFLSPSGALRYVPVSSGATPMYLN